MSALPKRKFERRPNGVAVLKKQLQQTVMHRVATHIVKPPLMNCGVRGLHG